ncbi:Hypothetical predicted protein [Mytilus galloprovincialis]|uniref:Endonuclease/exonuclease/phosphatase domain-containing protein n=1 Tax=Mytilus galloprovincialis TaxID=29158 RepID=A0A8B6DLB4_MYTGA|nr:Hypothetical predicted protein [Mytilus galloprovincialis]
MSSKTSPVTSKSPSINVDPSVIRHAPIKAGLSSFDHLPPSKSTSTPQPITSQSDTNINEGISTLRNENKKLRDDLDSLEQYGRRDLMRINDIPDGGNTETWKKTTELRRDDLEVPGVEVIWIQLKINNKNVLYGTFYVPPKSNNEIWTKIESSIESAVNDVKYDRIIVTGTFNNNLLNGANSKIHNICTNYSLEQLIEDPTHFTEQSSSLINLIITDNSGFAPYCGVGPPLLDKIRYHCPVMRFINAQNPDCLSFKRKIWLYKQGNFDEYRRILTKTNWDRIFALNGVDKINSEISNRILDAAEISMPNRIVALRKTDPALVE